jgi:Flp pilus assembly protein TadG
VRRFTMSSRLRRGRSRGQALVEFAFVVLPFCIIFFGTIEFALIMSSIGSYNFAVRDGARLGSLLGRTSGTADAQIIAVITNRTKGLVMARFQEIDIYRSTSDGSCLNATAPTAGSTVTVDDPTCVKDEYLYDSTGAQTNPVATWPPNVRDDSLQSADYLGVRILYRYTYLTGFIAGVGTPLNLSATSVQRIEPQDYSGMRHSTQPLELSERWSGPTVWGRPGAPGWLLSAYPTVALIPDNKGGRG